MRLTKLEVLKFIDDNSSFFKKPSEWFDKNWHIVEAFENTALKIIARGRTHYSARTIVEVLVHESIVSEKEGKFKIGNDNAPDLARVFVVIHPDKLNFWEYRREDHHDFKKLIKEKLC